MRFLGDAEEGQIKNEKRGAKSTLLFIQMLFFRVRYEDVLPPCIANDLFQTLSVFRFFRRNERTNASSLHVSRPKPTTKNQVHQEVLDWPGASPFWTPNPVLNNDDIHLELQRQTTALHEAARHGEYELLSMLLHHCRGRGLLPGACLTPDGNGERRRREEERKGLRFF